MNKLSPKKLAEWVEGEWTRLPNLDSVELVFDSRKVQEDSLFWPLRGERFDAHDFIQGMYNQKHEIFACEKQKRASLDLPSACVLLIEEGNKDLGKLARNRAREMQAKKIAITGSNGKTTTKEMLAFVLNEFGKTLATRGNLNNHIGVPMTLLEIEESTEFAIVEAGTNHPGEIAYLSSLIEPDLCVITNVGDSHLEFFITRENVLAEKVTIADSAKRNSKVLVPDEDQLLANWEPSNVEKISCSFEGMDLELNERACAKFLFRGTQVELNTPGLHNAKNALLVLRVVEELGLDLSRAVAKLNSFQGHSMRSEWKTCQEVEFLLDCYNANPSSMKAALEMFTTVGAENKGLILGSMFELGEESKQLHKELKSHVLEVRPSFVVLIGKEMACLFEELAEELNGCVFHFANVETAVEKVAELCSPRSCVLVKGSRGIKLDQLMKEIGCR